MNNSRQQKKGSRYLITCLMLIAVLFSISYLWQMAFGDGSTDGFTDSTHVDSGLSEQFYDSHQGASEQSAVRKLELPRLTANQPEQILEREGFTVSFNPKTNCPNYVCWYLTARRTRGHVERTDLFEGDPEISKDKRIEYFDYDRSRYDRGHMCPAADNKNSEKGMKDCFLMTNICPQAHNLNKGVWNDLEMECRSWARNYTSIHIACGPIFDKKRLTYIGQRKGHRIAVPDRFFKVIYMKGRVPKAIGFVYPNDDTNLPMRDYAMSVDEVERIAGIDFFYQLDDRIEDKIEAECNPSAWGI